ncbi:tripartite tricarboxylate transporter TctB family protein [Rhodobacter aestuarii]|uniref:Tripartite tricarboxylate transporter TctB family protein n=1 Tax=Rhodobacter aestuarii TaxID=453582 RepID=A0A1N7MN95_9RHOB|nr:tripartite tricarboxylate transporter TctB family protein [Rhodobacter aestuarii]PTV96648.1 tripartite tricarboxylate transporter TctB family protein [Rhodobacter aestuarii]SIS87510.1 Tripartite tricarboxylate transporter TctB family protein [Rhodobacter aestuarii]
MHDPNRRLPGERIFSVLMVAVSLFLFYTATQISGLSGLAEPGSFPMFATGMMVITSTIITFKTLRLPHSDVHGWKSVFPGLVILTIILMGFYALALQPVGFLPTSFVFLTIANWVMARGNPLRAALTSALSLVLVYVVFRLVFSVLMPEGIVPEREILAYIGSILNGGVK